MSGFCLSAEAGDCLLTFCLSATEEAGDCFCLDSGGLFSSAGLAFAFAKDTVRLRLLAVNFA